MKSSSFVEATHLTKKYDSFLAVNNIHFSIPQGICFGLLGPNGAGKTTTVKMIQCMFPPTEGTLSLFGLNASLHSREIKKRIGVCQQEDSLDPDFSVQKNLSVFARYFSIPKDHVALQSKKLLEFMGLWERKDSQIRELSGGLRRRLMIARSLINDPELIILDEPTTGLDPQSRHQVWDRIRKLRTLGKTILLTTHYMDEAQALCDQLMIMDQGKIIVQGSPQELITQNVGKEVLEFQEVSSPLLSFVKEKQLNHEILQDRLLVYSSEGQALLTSLLKTFHPKKYLLRSSGLEDVFLRLTGRDLRE